ncbi:nitroreductase family protein [Bacteroidota bacterium]
MLKDLVLKNRSYRRFYEDYIIIIETIKELIGLARLTPSAKNLQPLKYILSVDRDINNLIFRNLYWAGYLKNWPGPKQGERPTAYIIILGDKNLTDNYFCDPGIVAQTILLGAVEKKLGGCIFGSINHKGLRKDLEISDEFNILYVIALGKPKEKVVIKELGENGDIKYWRDENQTHYVPKRSLDEIILRKY